jgi:hypothetical protein
MLSGTKKDIHFIIGIGRSGTTLLSQLLNNHKEIQALPEANFLVFFLNQFQNKKQFTLNDINLLFEQIDVYSRSHPWVGWNFDLEKTKNKIYDTFKANTQVSYREICFQIYNQFIPNCSDDKSSSSILLDKNPSYTLYSDKLKHFLPNSKFILLIRDYRSNVLSRKQSVYFKSPNVAFNAMRWKLFNQKAFKFLNSHPDDFITLRYEDLVEDNQKAQLKIFDFFKIEHKIYPDLKTFNKVTAEEFKISDKFKERFYKKYGDLKKEVFTNRTEAWKEQLSKKEISICEAICGEYGEKFGYIQTTFLSPKQKFILKLKYLFPILLAHINIQKDMILYKISPKWKLKRLKKEYKKLGFID